MKTIIYTIFTLLILTIEIKSQNTNPEVTDVTFDISGTTVTVHYKVADAQQSKVTISMEASMDNKVTWSYPFSYVAGDIGVDIPVNAFATEKTITAEFTGTPNANWIIRIIADDEVGDQVYYAGKVYNTVTIGTQTWLKENLDVGTRLDGRHDQTVNPTIDKYCYNDDPAYCTTLGGLYQWSEAMLNSTVSGTKGICPSGWHIPTLEEFTTLKIAVADNGNALKEIGQGTGAGAGTNTSGFSALFSGWRFNDGLFYSFGLVSYFWSSSKFGSNYSEAYILDLQYNVSNITLQFALNEYGFSVRCVKDN